MKIKSLFAAALTAFFITSAHATHIKTLNTGDKAPAFLLKAQDGKTYSLKDYKKEIVVLEWFNNQCPFVEKHYGTSNMQDLQGKYTAKDKGVIWFSVSSTDAGKGLKPEDAAKIYKERDSHATALLLDSDGKMAREFGAKTTPHMFVIDRDGKIAYSGAIDDKPSFKKDTVKGAKNYVAIVLDSLLDHDKDPKKQVVKIDEPHEAYGCSVKITD